MTHKGLTLLLAGLLLGGCTPLGLLNAVVIGADYDRTAGLAYGEAPRQRLDVYRPTGAEGPAPVVVFFYGGRWQSGDRDDYRFVAEALTAKGFVTVIPDYRVYPEVMFPGFVEDAASAVAWVHAHIAGHGGNPRAIHLMGHSAGAHIAAMLTLDEHFLRDAGVPADTLGATVGLAGPYNFLPFTDADIKALMGPEAQWEQTQPINFVDGTEAPMLLLHGADDDIAWPANSTSLAERITARGGTAEVTLIDGTDHYEIVAAIAKPLRSLAPVLDRAAAFFRAHE